MFGFMALFLFGGMAVLAFLLTKLFGGDGQTAVLIWIGGIALVLTLPIIAIGLAIRAFRGIAMPLADVMSAADAVASGDLTVRVNERGPGEFTRLAKSFNRMTQELELTDQQRRNLTADVAHELRTPLHIIQGNLEGILDGVYEPTPDHLNSTLDETRLLGRLVEDLRTLSLAESGQLQLDTESFSVTELLHDIATTFSGQAEAAGVDLVVDDSSLNQPVVIMADITRMNQVIGNLLVNALRHTEQGGTITLAGIREANRVRLQVQDTGSGIPPDDLTFVFDRFWKGDRSRSREGSDGSGLGLPIAKQLIENQGGTIAVESTQGQGTTFTIAFPVSG
jgi:two-component system OmpR family sensor kinase/two-component system sensor histidine kinase BaeS